MLPFSHRCVRLSAPKPFPQHGTLRKRNPPRPLVFAGRVSASDSSASGLRYYKNILGKRAPKGQILTTWVFTGASVALLYLSIPHFGTLASRVGQGDLRGLGRTSGYLSLLIFGRSVCLYFQDVLGWNAALQIVDRVRQEAFVSLLSLDVQSFNATTLSDSHSGSGSEDVVIVDDDNKRGFEDTGYTAGVVVDTVGSLSHRLTFEAEKSAILVHAFIQRLIPGILQIVGMVCRMLTLAPALTAATLVVAPLMGLLATALGEVVRRSSSRDVKASSNLSAHIAEVFSMFEFVTIQGALSYELGRLSRLSKTFLERRIRTEKIRALLPVLLTFIYTLTIIFLFATSCWLVGRNQISSTNVVAFCTTLVFLMEPIQGVSAAFNEMKQNQASLDRLLHLVNLEKENKVAAKEKTAESKSSSSMVTRLVGAPAKLDIEFESVSFAYMSANGERANAQQIQILDHCSLQIPYGKRVGLMGLSGSGKSTLAKLAAGLYTPQGGLVKIAGIEVTSIDQQELLQTLSLIPQEPPLIEGTVMENLKYGLQRTDVQLGEVEAVCKLVALHDDIVNLKDGYHSHVSGYSNNLSGGQKQRLAMARALLRRPEILILDEAFAALDIQTAKKVKRAIEGYMAGRTIIYIAHQLETVTDLDYLYIIDKGRVAEEGCPSHLLKRKSGIYATISEITKSKRELQP